MTDRAHASERSRGGSAPMQVVVMGCGRIGADLANRLSAEGHRVTVIDLSAEAFEKYLYADFKGQTVLGDGIDEDVLRAAGIDRADAFVAAAGGDNHNLMAAQIATVVFGVKRVVCRCNDLVRAETYAELGLATVSPSHLASVALRDALLDDARHRRVVAQAIGQLLVQ